MPEEGLRLCDRGKACFMTDVQRKVIRNQPSCSECRDVYKSGRTADASMRAIENADKCDECLELIKVHCVAYRESS